MDRPHATVSPIIVRSKLDLMNPSFQIPSHMLRKGFGAYSTSTNMKEIVPMITRDASQVGVKCLIKISVFDVVLCCILVIV